MKKFDIVNTLFSKENPILYDKKILATLKKIADKSKLKRSRICLHHSNNSRTHEMIISLKKGSYIQPHKHPNSKYESYHVISGKMDVFIFDNKGAVKKIIKMTDINKGGQFFFRLKGGTFHMPISKSKYCYYHEVYEGPFIKSRDVEYATFAPAQFNNLKIKSFLDKINFS